jgi:hypothetical protein
MLPSAPRSDHPAAVPPKPRQDVNASRRPEPVNGPRLLDTGLEAPRSSDC